MVGCADDLPDVAAVFFALTPILFVSDRVRQSNIIGRIGVMCFRDQALFLLYIGEHPHNVHVVFDAGVIQNLRGGKKLCGGFVRQRSSLRKGVAVVIVIVKAEIVVGVQGMDHSLPVHGCGLGQTAVRIRGEKRLDQLRRNGTVAIGVVLIFPCIDIGVSKSDAASFIEFGCQIIPC